MNTIKKIVLVASLNKDIAKFVETLEYQTIDKIKGLYLIATTQSINELKTSLEAQSKTQADFCIFAISASECSKNHSLASWISKTLQDPYATRLLTLPTTE